MSAWARPGVKCVCIGDTKFGPKAGDECVVSEVEADERGVWLYIEGHDQWHGDATGLHQDRYSFRVDCFRPLISLEQDLAQFTHHLIREGAPV